SIPASAGGGLKTDRQPDETSSYVVTSYQQNAAVVVRYWTAKMGKPERFVLIVGGGVLAIAALAVAVIVAIGGPKTAEYDPASPEGVVQRYLEAARIGDDNAVRELLSERALRQLDADGIHDKYRPAPLEDNRLVTLQRTVVQGDHATVWLRIESPGGSGLSLDRYSWTMPVPLVRENGNWRVDEPYATPF
ncbi:MAG TPA: hypothetical protein DCX80_09550, partial [Chloroflexi bacterium]|nr:hypothetical protein [Chloroflexota bacterium]